MFLFFAACVCLAGCRSTEVRIDKAEWESTFAPLPERGNILAKFSCDTERPEDPSLAQFAEECLAEAYRHARGNEKRDSATMDLYGIRDSFFSEYNTDFVEIWPEVKTNSESVCYMLQWTCHVEGRVVFCDEDYFSYRVIIDTYCGGAHPNRWVQNATYSRRTGRRVTVADVIKKESMTSVVNLIRKAVRKDTQEGDMLHEMLAEEIRKPYDEYVQHNKNGWGNPLVTENFMLTKDGIVWTYNQYEIACYASGLFDALVPWETLGPHLRNGENRLPANAGQIKGR